MTDTKSTFSFPKFYDFPPFFTIQPVQKTRHKQLSIWVEFLRNYQKHTRSTSVEIVKAAADGGAPFGNPKIKRKLTADGIKTVLNEFCHQGYGVWADESHSICRTSWKKFEEWGTILYNWAKDNGQLGRICTLNEIRTENSSEEFHMMEPELLHAALKRMEKGGLAELYPGDTLDELGIKIVER
eukprot:CAMPEP_0170181404 /NCGR_PEP_ID=MMETSP0040_2-20121228/25077_1 /TAXON_ID=641309 /ORGANISM="Lotharella oceanica, Strain CCMP622" /LENGTH=183 /DNA_ID=CAMNT_0010426447 /DNA_START=19 /DNA_END=570 /DNA_ORIENTATION=-